jgi:hypothetical protein
MNRISPEYQSEKSSAHTFKDYSYELTGHIHIVDETKTFESGFQSKSFVILTQEFSPKPVPLRVIAGRVKLLDGISVGTLVKLIFKIKGREWQSKYLINLEVYNLEVLEHAKEQHTESAQGNKSEEVYPF